MKVSVLIPVYNRKQYIAGAVRSVLAQSYQDLEIVVVDDGSTDDIESVLRPLLPQIRYIRTRNQGVALARNVGMEAARGDYLAFLDSDDLYYPFKIQMQARLLDETPEIGMVYTNFSAFSDEGYWDEFHLRQYHASAYGRGNLRYDDIFSDRKALHESGFFSPLQRELQQWCNRSVYFGHIYDAYRFNTIVFTNSMMFRRELVHAVGMQEKRFGMFHDLEFALRLTQIAKTAFIDVPSYQLRYHPEQISTTNRSQGELVAIKIQQDLLRVTKYHLTHDREYYAQNRKMVDLQLARLCRAVAVPLLSFECRSPKMKRQYSKRARTYLAKCSQYGMPDHFLQLLSYAPHIVRRIAFKAQAIVQNSKSRFDQGLQT
jgi:GT2 family glycosyltransferase